MKHSMAKEEKDNQTMIAEFILLGFRTLPQLQTIFFVIFLIIYMVTMAGNILIVVVIIVNCSLHKPMYFFLGNLSVLETCYTSTILPRILTSFVTDNHRISFSGCFLQFYFFAFLAGAESYLLSIMSYDRYIAICKPLYYITIMKNRSCIQLSLVSWMVGLVAAAVTTFFTSQLTFCGTNKIDHFFCDYAPLLMLSCSPTEQTEMAMLVLGSVCTLPPLFLTMTSYIFIIRTILGIPSTTGGKKAFSTCSSHLVVVTIFYGTLIIVYLLPKDSKLRNLNKEFSVFYTILTPMINPFLYTLRNGEFKKALGKTIGKLALLRISLGIQPR
ncbi:olfactory receptor 2AP1-like [Protobothrops mucrosquamatus]|uniref:olfactory receptor 2AP1-like n=1 Tax=Protobothrops mucrosquamatus TaxID=103944 RepID=UPI0010FBB5FE|nr:olfactory receptor 2AP1-like [Protobothrops mucrosquamatus]